MPNYGPQCKNCGGEDCPCCEVFIEYQADIRAARDYEGFETYEGDEQYEEPYEEDEGEEYEEREDFGWGGDETQFGE